MSLLTKNQPFKNRKKTLLCLSRLGNMFYFRRSKIKIEIHPGNFKH